MTWIAETSNATSRTYTISETPVTKGCGGYRFVKFRFWQTQGGRIAMCRWQCYNGANIPDRTRYFTSVPGLLRAIKKLETKDGLSLLDNSELAEWASNRPRGRQP